MADRKLTQLVELTAPTLDDELYGVDESEPSNADKSKRIKIRNVTALVGGGNTAFLVTARPSDSVGKDGDVAIARVSSIVVHAYRKLSGSWVRQWAFSGGEAVLLTTGLSIIPDRQPASDPDTTLYSRWIGISGYAPVTLDDFSHANPPSDGVITGVADMRGGSTRTVAPHRSDTLNFSQYPISFDYSAIEVYLWFALENTGNAHALLITSVAQGGVDIPIVAQAALLRGIYTSYHTVGTYTQAEVESGDFELTIEKDASAPNTYNRYAVVTQSDTPTAADFVSDDALTSTISGIAVPSSGWESGRGYLHFALPASQDAPSVAGIPGGINLIDDFTVRSTANTITINGDSMRTLSSDDKVFQMTGGYERFPWVVR